MSNLHEGLIAVFHELAHHYQTPQKEAYINPTRTLKSMMDHLIQPDEIDAYVRELQLLARKYKTTFDFQAILFLNKFFDVYAQKFKTKSINNAKRSVLNVWRRYHSEKFIFKKDHQLSK